MIPFAKIGAKTRSTKQQLTGAGVRVYFLRKNDGVLYYFARVFGHPNMRVAVTEKEAMYAKHLDTQLSIEDRGKQLAEERVLVWLQEAARTRVWPK